MESFIPTPSQAMAIVWASLKRESFSKQQTAVQKIILGFLGLLIFVVSYPLGLAAALYVSVSAFLTMRWINLKVFAPHKNIMFLFAAAYISILSSYSAMYAVLYRRILRHIKIVDFPPYVPYNQQTLTQTATTQEMLKRDKFWKNLLPRNLSESVEKRFANVLTVVRGIGDIWLYVHVGLPPEQFFSIVAALFITDYFDGIWARLKKRITTFGEWADPIADRGLIGACLYYLYVRNQEFWSQVVFSILLPEITLLIVFGILFFMYKFVYKETIKSPRPVVWGRIKFFVYFLGVLAFLFSWFQAATLLFFTGSLFAWIAVLSYLTREYQEKKGESVFNGMLRWCIGTTRIKKEFSFQNLNGGIHERR